MAYYDDRAHEYDRVYQKPERQADLALIKPWLQTQAKGKRILEIGCGTGYWTQVMAETAASVQATDLSAEMLTIAQHKSYYMPIQWQEADYYQLDHLDQYDLIFAGFVWSHIPREKGSSFLASLSSHLAPQGQLILLDNRYVEGSNTPLSRTDAEGNTYQQRHLQDGRTYEVMKNFPTEEELTQLHQPFSRNITYISWTYFWGLSASKTESPDSLPDG